MTRRLLLPLAFSLLVAVDAAGYEAQSTHVGLTERAAYAIKLHQILVKRWGLPLGLYQPLRLKPPRELAWRLDQLDPVEGLRPDGEQNTALGWLLAGAALEDLPPARTRNHFFDPRSGQGLREHGLLLRLFYTLFGDHEVGGAFGLEGRPAPEWALARENELGLHALEDALEQTGTGETVEARTAAAARALLCLGALAHLLEDMGSPSHVRNDFRGDHLQHVPGSSVWDQRSLYERFVAQRYGRLGVPAPAGSPEPHAHLRDYFVALAGWVQPRFFSAGTLPRELDARGLDAVALAERANRSLVLPAPRVEKLDPGREGVLSSKEVPVLASYVVEKGELRFELDERAHAVYARLLLPRVVRATADLLAFLVRGQLQLVQTEDGWVIENRGPALASGTLRLLSEDQTGRRRPLEVSAPAAWPVATGAVVGRVPAGRALPDGTKRLVAVFRGQDAAGEPLVAIETVPAQAPPTTSSN